MPKNIALRYISLQLQNKTCHCSFRLYLNYEQTNKLSTLFAFGENGVFHVSETRSLSHFNIQPFFCFIFFKNFLHLIICTLQICIVDAWLDSVVYTNTSGGLTLLFANAFMVWNALLVSGYSLSVFVAICSSIVSVENKKSVEKNRNSLLDSTKNASQQM